MRSEDKWQMNIVRTQGYTKASGTTTTTTTTTNAIITESTTCTTTNRQRCDSLQVQEKLFLAAAGIFVVFAIVLLLRVFKKKMMLMWRRASSSSSSSSTYGAASRRILVKNKSSPSHRTTTTRAISTMGDNTGRSRCYRRYRGPTALFAVATTVAGVVRPVVSAMEASTSATSAAATSDQADSSSTAADANSSKRQCYSYGCPMLPQDIYYNEPVKNALASLRMYKRDQVVDGNNDDDNASSTSDTSVATISSSSSQLEALEPSGSKYYGTLTLIGYKGGSLESQINQDRAFCVSPYRLEDWNDDDKQKKKKEKSSTDHQENNDNNEYPRVRQLLGVFDGHANLGEKVSQYTVSKLPVVLAEKLKKTIQGSKKGTKSPSDTTSNGDEQDDDSIQQALIETFVEIDKTAPAEISGGCTASVIYQDGSKVYVANAGDSQSFLAVYRAKTQTVQVIYVSREDKPELPEERARVEKMGGAVYLPLRGTSRVLYTDPETGMQSGLAMSRSIGDWEAGKLGVIPNPIVDVIHIPELVEAQLAVDCVVSADPDDGGSTYNPECMSGGVGSDDDDVYVFAVSATDGLMDFATPDIIAQTVAGSLFAQDGPHLLTALEQLIYMAAQGWDQAKQGRYRDDIAISVAQIRTPPNATEASSSTASS